MLAPVSPAFADLWAASTDASYSRVIRFDNQGNELPGGIPSFSAGLVAPGGITVGPDGTIYVSSRGNSKILSYTCDDTSCTPQGLPGNPAGEFATLAGATPAQLKFGPDGNLYVSELFGQNVRVYNPTSGAQLANAASGLPGTGGIAFEADGDLLVGTVVVPDFMIPATISRFSGGVQQSPFFVDTQGDLSFASSLMHLPNGDLVAVDLFGDKLHRFTSNGLFLGNFGLMAPIIEGKPNFPSDIVYDPDGNLIVAVLGPNNPGDPGGNQGQLLRYSVEGHFLEIIASQLEQVGALAWTASPETRAGDFDNDGDVDAADYAKWKSDFGKLVATANGADGNGNGLVDAGDYTIWRDAFFEALDGAASASAVPEPSTAALAVLSLVLALRSKTRSYIWS
jgi:sugar lactone lactonase YvrE